MNIRKPTSATGQLGKLPAAEVQDAESDARESRPVRPVAGGVESPAPLPATNPIFVSMTTWDRLALIAVFVVVFGAAAIFAWLVSTTQ